MDQIDLFPSPPPHRRKSQPQEWKVVSLRECPTPDALQMCDTPEKAVEYWNTHVRNQPYVSADCECLVVLLLNTRRRVKGHHLVSIGTLDTILVSPSAVFRVAVIAAAAAIVCMHNHPSGEAMPSEADIKVTRDLMRAGQLLRIELVDHIIVGAGQHCSLRTLGYLAT